MKRIVPYACVALLIAGTVVASVLSLASSSTVTTAQLQALALQTGDLPSGWHWLKGEPSTEGRPASLFASCRTSNTLLFGPVQIIDSWSGSSHTDHGFLFERIGKTSLTSVSAVRADARQERRLEMACYAQLNRRSRESQKSSDFVTVQLQLATPLPGPPPSLQVSGLVSSSRYGFAFYENSVSYTFLRNGVLAQISFTGSRVTPGVLALIGEAARRL